LLESKKVKEMIKRMGSDLCGIAPVERFNEAPDGFHPTDIYNECKSVVVFAKKFLKNRFLLQVASHIHM
jgi:hypothetical protein